MNALSYYIIKKAKNQFLQFLRSPGKVIYALLLAFTMIMAFTAKPSVHSMLRDKNELYVILWAVYTLVFITSSKNGFSSGSSLFSMADVNLLFTSPIRNASVLIHAMVQQLGRSLFVGVILLLQFDTVNSYYGVGYGMFLLMVCFYGVAVFMGQMLSVMIYTFCSSGDGATRIIKILYYGVICAFAVPGILGAFDHGTFTVESAVRSLSGDMFKFFPVSGFLVMILEAIGEKLTGRIVLGLLLILMFITCFFIVVFLRKFDFYEDVINSAEMSTNTGSVDSQSSDSSMPRNIKIGKTGFRKGFGASAITEKNKIENRRGKVLYIDALTVVYAVICGVCTFFSSSVWMIFLLNIYLTMFSVSAGRWVKELKLHYIYLIPEKSRTKLFYMLKEQLPVHLVQSIVIFLPMQLFMKTGVVETISIILARFGFCMLFTAVTLTMKNLFSSTDKGAFYGFIYMAFCLLVSVPSIVSAVLMYMIFIFNFEFAFFSLFIVNTAVAALLVCFNRKLLEKGM